jgi:hypothetical protein
VVADSAAEATGDGGGWRGGGAAHRSFRKGGEGGPRRLVGGQPAVRSPLAAGRRWRPAVVGKKGRVRAGSMPAMHESSQ